MNATRRRLVASGLMLLAMYTGYTAWRMGQKPAAPASTGSTAVPVARNPFSPPPVSTLQITPELPTVSHIPASAGDLNDCNLLLVTLDTTRADRLGCYGNGSIKTPTLDRLACEGLVFSDVTAVAPETLPSHASLMTGLYPVHHGAHSNGLFRLEDGHETLAERLAAEGFRTGAVISAFVLNAQAGLAQGFEYYDDDLPATKAAVIEHFQERTARHTTARALAWLEQVESERFFLWVHYFDPHHVYSPPSPFAEEYQDNPYDGEIAFVDSALGELLDGLAAAGLDSKTLVAVVGDHGEGLGQHHEMTHPYLVYDGTLRVPLILHAGDRLGGGVHCTLPASQVDVAPTLLSLLGLGFEGVTDAQNMLAPEAEEQPRFFQTMAGALEFGWEPLTGVCFEDYKYIHSSEPELYHRVDDPAELINVALTEPAVAEHLRGLVQQAFGGELGTAPTPTVQPTMAELEKLQALGYLETNSGGPTRANTALLPQVMMPVLHRVAMAEHDSKPAGQRIAELTELVEEYPEFYPAWKALGTAQRRNRALDEAALALQRCLELRPDTPQTIFELALVHTLQSQHAETVRLLKPVIRDYPDYARALFLYATALRRLHHDDEAIGHFKAVLKIDPNYPLAINRLIDACTAAGRSAEIPEYLEKKLAEAPRATGIRIALADHYESQRESERADETLRAGLKLNPDDADLVRHIVISLANHEDPERRDRQAAIDVLVTFLDRMDPPPVAGLTTLSDLYIVVGNMEAAIATAERARDCAFAEGGAELRAMTEKQLAKVIARSASRAESAPR
ncbi:MAG: arylsulfatase A-like enzyme/tetratricopeptide (TPR) repeat protein [Chlamydiales bacterium]|jgi:arylsulfatase A-like enzyme/tetratricopeptide (TPR) repeat protein